MAFLSDSSMKLLVMLFAILTLTTVIDMIQDYAYKQDADNVRKEILQIVEKNSNVSRDVITGLEIELERGQKVLDVHIEFANNLTQIERMLNKSLSHLFK